MPLAHKILTSVAHATLIEKDMSIAQVIAVALAMNLPVTARSVLIGIGGIMDESASGGHGCQSRDFRNWHLTDVTSRADNVGSLG